MHGGLKNYVNSILDVGGFICYDECWCYLSHSS
jgi:hypothetical protein